MTSPTPGEIQDLLKRLQEENHPPEHVLEAGELLASSLAPPDGFRMAVDFFSSRHARVRQLGLGMMRGLAARHEAARGFLEGTQDAAKLLGASAPVAAGGGGAAEKKPDYSAIGEVIKAWLRESKAKGQGSTRR